MEPARLRAVLARTPGLTARHLKDASPGGFTPDLLPRLLEGELPGRTRRWLQQPDERLIESDLRWIETNNGQICSCLDADFPAALAALGWAPATLYVSGLPRLRGGP